MSSVDTILASRKIGLDNTATGFMLFGSVVAAAGMVDWFDLAHGVVTLGGLWFLGGVVKQFSR